MNPTAGALLLVAGATLALPRRGAIGSAARRRALRRRVRVRFPAAPRLALAAGAACIAGTVSWLLLALPIVTLLAAAAGGASPYLHAHARAAAAAREAERAWSAALDQLADALEVGLAFPAAVALLADGGPSVLRGRFEAMLAPLRRGELEAAIATLAAAPEHSARSAAVLLRAALVEVPAGGLAPLLRELARVARGRFASSERARIRSLALRREANVLAVSPLAFLLLIGWSSPGYLDAYRTVGGTLVSLAAALAIGGCYLAMLRLGRLPGAGR